MSSPILDDRSALRSRLQGQATLLSNPAHPPFQSSIPPHPSRRVCKIHDMPACSFFTMPQHLRRRRPWGWGGGEWGGSSLGSRGISSVSNRRRRRWRKLSIGRTRCNPHKALHIATSCLARLVLQAPHTCRVHAEAVSVPMLPLLDVFGPSARRTRVPQRTTEHRRRLLQTEEQKTRLGPPNLAIKTIINPE